MSSLAAPFVRPSAAWFVGSSGKQSWVAHALRLLPHSTEPGIVPAVPLPVGGCVSRSPSSTLAPPRSLPLRRASQFDLCCEDSEAEAWRVEAK